MNNSFEKIRDSIEWTLESQIYLKLMNYIDAIEEWNDKYNKKNTNIYKLNVYKKEPKKSKR
jgi:16S rRNA G527 N7-methylase RsmG